MQVGVAWKGKGGGGAVAAHCAHQQSVNHTNVRKVLAYMCIHAWHACSSLLYIVIYSMQ